MNKILLSIISFLFSTLQFISQSSPILIPQKIEIQDKGCLQDSSNIKQLLNKAKSWGYQLNSEYYNNHVLIKDINKDGNCEYILKYYDGGANIIEEIYLLKNNEFITIGKFWENSYSFLSSDTDYPDILVNYYDGHKTNPIWKYKILRYNGTKYTTYQSPNYTYGNLKDFGLKFYKERNYPLAEIYFSNILTVFGHTTTDINNLAISLIKQEKNEIAEKLLLQAIKIKESDDSYYNLSLIYKNKKNISQELNYLIQSNNLKPSDFKTERINELKKMNKL